MIIASEISGASQEVTLFIALFFVILRFWGKE